MLAHGCASDPHPSLSLPLVATRMIPLLRWAYSGELLNPAAPIRAIDRAVRPRSRKRKAIPMRSSRTVFGGMDDHKRRCLGAAAADYRLPARHDRLPQITSANAFL